MNTYLIPTTAAYINGPYDHILMVHSSSPTEAYISAKDILKGIYIPLESDFYESYLCEFYMPKEISMYPFHESKKHDILTLSFKNTKGMEHMGHFQVDWNNYTNELKEKAANEIWSNNTYKNNGILSNYLVHTYEKLIKEKKVILKNYGLFNTGLFTKYYDPIYAYSNEDYKISFKTGYELNFENIQERPSRADYFSKPELLLFDWHFPIDVQFDHILEDKENIKRLPKSFVENKNKICILTGALDIMKKKVSSNYKLAVPQYYNGKIQLLLPLCLDSDNEKPDLALAVTKLNNCYQGHTCLTLDMAYNNARLIAKPESNWLSQ